MNIEATLKAGDICLDCQKLGLEKFLRYFKINLNGDTILKCESNECMFPYNDEMSSSSDEDEKSADNLVDTNSLNFINDFIQQCSNDEPHNKNNDFPINKNDSEQVAQFDITFLDDLSEIETKNLCKTEVSTESDQSWDNKLNDNIIESKYLPVNVYENKNITEQNDSNISHLHFTDDTTKDCKGKINIQSIETIKFESALYNLPTSSKTITSLNDNTSKYFNSSDPTTIPQIRTFTSTETAKKSLQTSKKKKSRSNLQTTTPINATNLTPLQLSYSAEKPPLNTLDIPKADIMKGNALLKQIVEVNKMPAASGRINKCVRSKQTAKTDEIKKLEKHIPTQSNGLGYSIEQISEMLLRHKMKTKIKK